MFLTIVTFFIVLSVLVFAHELGHFWTARLFGVKAEEFGFGFPPRIFGVQLWREKDENGRPTGKRKWHVVKGSRLLNEEESARDTVYSLNWIPMGGFVKIKGENGDSEDTDSFVNKKIWQKAIILSAGVIMNIILASALISIGLMIGSPQAINGISDKATITGRQIQIVEVLADSPASQAGVEAGDTIEAIDGQPFRDYDSLQGYVSAHVGQELAYTIKRNDQLLEKKVVPQLLEGRDIAGIGIAIMETGTVRYPWHLAAKEGVYETYYLAKAVLAAYYELFKNLIIGQGLSADLAGPVGIAKLTGQAAQMGIVYLINFTAMLSINLAILNFLPLPALDGGRVLFLIIEKIKGRPVKREVEAVIHNVGFALLMLLVVWVTFKDISRMTGGARAIWERLFG